MFSIFLEFWTHVLTIAYSERLRYETTSWPFWLWIHDFFAAKLQKIFRLQCFEIFGHHYQDSAVLTCPVFATPESGIIPWSSPRLVVSMAGSWWMIRVLGPSPVMEKEACSTEDRTTQCKFIPEGEEWRRKSLFQAESQKDECNHPSQATI